MNRCMMALVGAAFLAASAAGAAKERPTPNELTKYVAEARKLGLTDDEIRKNAIGAGWQASIVDQAVHLSPPAAAPPLSPPTTPAATPADSQAVSPPVVRDHGVPDEYRIGEGDILQIKVWKEPDASVQAVTVRPDGKIAVPLLKEVTVAGLTPSGAEQMISERLSKYIRGADVSVVVTDIRSRKVYVIGAVKKEGAIALTHQMRILQVLSEAGGLTDYAKRKRIYLLRTENGQQFRFPFNYDAVIKGEQIEQNIWVTPDDTIVVPR